MAEILKIDYNDYVELIGTAHFTRRSINDAYESVTSFHPQDIALELDWRRFRKLNTACLSCPRPASCNGLCEFIAATDALGNADANIWLIDMTEQEMRQRISSSMTPFERSNIGHSRYRYAVENPLQLWERGLKERVLHNSKREIARNRRFFPSVWRVLIDERNALMAVRLAWIASKNLNDGKTPRILTFVGAAHVEGIRDLLRSPLQLRETMMHFNLSFAEPTLIRRVAVQVT